MFKIYFIALFVFLFMDALWLGVIAKDFYQKKIGFLMRESVNWIAAAIFYLLFILGLTIFSIEPAIEASSWIESFFSGALFGLIAYATYDLTNLATIKGWPISVTVVDLFWGSFIGGSVSVITYFLIIELII